MTGLYNILLLLLSYSPRLFRCVVNINTMTTITYDIDTFVEMKRTMHQFSLYRKSTFQKDPNLFR